MATEIATPVPLESGDHLTREEFHRRYLARPDIKRAELIDGVVFVSSPVRAREHGRPHASIMIWLGAYVVPNPAVELLDNSSVFLDDGTVVQPDALLWLPAPGAARLTDDGYLEGAPQLVVEVAASSASYDLHNKKAAYQRKGVREYVVWRVIEQAIDWFHLEGGQYLTVQPDAEGVIESAQFPGLRLDVPQMLAGDLAAVLRRVSAGPDNPSGRETPA